MLAILFFFCCSVSMAQTPQSMNSAEILLGLKKLKVIGSVLYIAAHPDDENTRLLTYLSKERLFRTGYLSMTRGDGGQNLIGDEQGVELGLIRTQELLAARRIDGAEQFFTRAYDFGFSKSTDEALRIWNKEKILSDVVWVIRKFQPDVIITRFPPDSRAGHGHHSASAVLAREAFDAAADPNRFPEQFAFGVKPWKAKRIFWNTFNFGGNNTTSNDQLKIDVGGFNPLLGKSYGEISSEGRSMHKSQGFGVPRQRGFQTEFFTLTGGDAVQNDLVDGIVTDWSRYEGGAAVNAMIDHLIAGYSFQNPSASVKELVELYKAVEQIKDGDWRKKKLEEIKQLIEACAGLYIEATTNQEYVVFNDTLNVNFSLINRSIVPVQLKSIKIDSCRRYKIPDSLLQKYPQYAINEENKCKQQIDYLDSTFNKDLVLNQGFTFSKSLFVTHSFTEPYWIKEPMETGSFNISNQQLIGMAESAPAYTASFTVTINGSDFVFTKPVLYKYTDQVKGELYQKLVVYPAALIKASNSFLLFNNTSPKTASFTFSPLLTKPDAKGLVSINKKAGWTISPESAKFDFIKNQDFVMDFTVKPDKLVNGDGGYILPNFTSKFNFIVKQRLRKIEYDHIPTITYFPDASTRVITVDVKVAGKKVGYITGAGDFVPYCLQQMGYEVDVLKESDLSLSKLKQYDAIVTGVRAYNVHAWLSSSYDVLMQYVKEGGVLLVQYNRSNNVGQTRAKISPYPFTVSQTRVSEEDAAVTMLRPEHPVFNYPNKITVKDFEGWVQERSINEADNMDEHYVPLISMSDAGEPAHKGSLIVTDYGKGRFIYTGLVFFRELPAGVPGAYRLMANLLAKPLGEK